MFELTKRVRHIQREFERIDCVIVRLDFPITSTKSDELTVSTTKYATNMNFEYYSVDCRHSKDLAFEII